MNQKNSQFTLDFEDFEDIEVKSTKQEQKYQRSKNSSDQKKNFVQSKSQLMFQAKTISKGFFQQQNQSYASLMSEDSSPTKLFEKKSEQQNQDNHVKSRRKKKVDKLQPLSKQIQKVQVFRNFQQTNNLYSSRKAKKSTSKSKDQKDQQKKISAQKGKRKRKQKQNQQQQEKIEDYKSQTISEENNCNLINDPIQNKKQTEVKNKVQQPPQKKKNVIFQPDDKQIQDDEDSPNKLVQEGQNLQKHIIKIMSSPLKPNTVMKMTLQRNASGFNTFWPVFHLHFLQDKSYLMSAKKTSSKPTSTFIMASSKENFQQNTQVYLGKVKSNFMGDTLTIFGPGLNPNNAFEMKQRPRQVLASIVYQSSYFQGGKPRDFKVFLKKSKVDYYRDFPEVKLYEDEIPLNVLYQNQANRDKITILKNRTPQYKAQIKGYMLNFKGRVTKPSIKNFILQDIEKPGFDVMIFGKIGDNTFSLDVYHPLSPCIGFGIAMSSFDSRILIQ